ncbi:TIGR00645 family protein [Agromyces sp. MMS17-SY077]|uniref:UPF0114 protein GB864_03785 n=1 Tax=Agromyces seonyuensis TaxID=2662446 RepID=A0A6I4P391_9MICO|nr:TIGR00645 family protein [Agromyces seonyuensis]
MTRTAPWGRAVGGLIFASRWLQAPLYVGLIIAQLIYVVVFLVELWHLGESVFHDPTHIDEATIMLGVLGLIDVVMIANLLIMVIIGGYETFVSRIGVDGHPDQPEWLSHVNANVLKVKLAMAIIGISSIHLLKTFIEVGGMTDSGVAAEGERYTSTGVMWQVVIHLVFIVSALALAAIDRMSYHRVSPHEVHDGLPVPYPDFPQPGEAAAPAPAVSDATEPARH